MLSIVTPIYNRAELLSRCFNSLRIQTCKDFEWIVVDDGALRVKVEALVKEKSIGEAVMFLGVRSDVLELLQTMDVFILPSLCESLPVAAVEAQAAGHLCLRSDNITGEVAITVFASSCPSTGPMRGQKPYSLPQAHRVGTCLQR